MKNAVIYCRVSSDRQSRESDGMKGQERMCRHYAERLGYRIVGTFGDEGVSGGVIERPGMQRMLAFLDDRAAKREETVVIVDDIKRWARDVEGHFALKTAITARHAVLESPTHRFEDSPEGKFVETVLAGAAELERNQNKRQVCSRMKARLETGYWTFDNPPGYVYQRVPGHKKLLVPDEPKASVIKEMLEGFASGRFATKEDARRFLESKGFKHRAKKPGVYIQQVTRILTRVLYTGYVEYDPWEVSLRKGYHQPLISMETYTRIQERLQEQERSPHRKDIHKDFPLRGFVLCSQCRQPMTAGWTQGRSQKYAYYRCKTKGCCMRNKNIPRKKMEDDFEDVLRKVKPRENILEVVRIELLALWHGKINDLERIRKRRNDRLEEIQNDIKDFCALIKTAKSNTVRRTYEERIEELEEELVRLGAHKTETDARHYAFEPALNKVIAFIKEPFLMWQTGDLVQRRLVLRMVFEGPLVYDHERGFYTKEFEPKLSLPVELSCIPVFDEIERRAMVEMPGIEPGSNVSLHGSYCHVRSGSPCHKERTKNGREG